MGGVSHVEFCEILRRTKPNGASPPQAANANAKADSDGPVRRLRTDAATDEKAPTVLVARTGDRRPVSTRSPSHPNLIVPECRVKRNALL
jgi:hypothetical protein